MVVADRPTLPKIRKSATHETLAYHMSFAHGEWATWFICNGTGTLVLQSDWGTWGHRWPTEPRQLGHDTLVDFLRVRAGPTYVARKLMAPLDRVLDVKATRRNITQSILEARTQGKLDHDNARFCYDEIKSWSGAEDELARLDTFNLLPLEWMHVVDCDSPAFVIVSEALFPMLRQRLASEVP